MAQENFVVSYKVCFADSKPIPHPDESISLVRMDDLALLDRPITALSYTFMTLLTELSFYLVAPSPRTSSVAILTDDTSLSITTITGVKGSD